MRNKVYEQQRKGKKEVLPGNYNEKKFQQIVIDSDAAFLDLKMIISLLHIALAITAIVGAPSSEDDICYEHLNNLPCNILPDVVQSDGLFSISKTTLQNNCTDILGSFKCLRDHWAKCNPLSMEDFVMYVSGFKRIAEELCNSNSKLRKNYEKHTPCLRRASKVLQNCTHVAEQKVRILRKDNPRLHFLSVSAYRCLAHIELVGCVRQVGRDYCGPAVGQLLGGLVERAIRPYRYLKCNRLEHLKQPSKKEDYERAYF